MSNKANCYNKVFSSGNITDIILANPKGSFRIDPGVTGMPRATYWIVTTFTGLDGYLYATVISLDNMEQYTICYNQGSTPKFSSWREIATTESGTWTPLLAGKTVAGNFSYRLQDGYYARTGNIVVVSARLSTTTVNTAPTGEIIIKDLPFNPKKSAGGVVNYVASSGNQGFCKCVMVNISSSFGNYVAMRGIIEGLNRAIAWAADMPVQVGAMQLDLHFSITYEI